MGKSQGAYQKHTTRDKDFSLDQLDETPLTNHAVGRTSGRGISPEQVQRVIDHGRCIHERHSTIYFVGDKEVADDRTLDDCNGIHVVCAPIGNVVITVYRNKHLNKEKFTLGQKRRKDGLKRRFRDF